MAFTQGLCNAFQVYLNDVAGKNAPALKRDRVGYLDALMSSLNTAGVEKIPVPSDGKYRETIVKFYQRGVASDIAEDCEGILDCSGDIEQEPFEQKVAVDDCIATKGLIFNENEMRKLCESDATWISNIIMGQMNAINVQLDKRILADAVANFGVFADGTNLKEVPLFTPAPENAPRSIAMAQIRHQYDEVGSMGVPLIIGSGNFDLYAKSQEIACCNSSVGTDLSLWSDYAYYNDRFVEGIAGAGHFIVLAPNVTQLLTWNKYLGDYAKRNDVFEHGTLTDPFTGLTYDMKVHYDDCKEQYTIKLFLHYKLWQLPADSFAGTDDFAGVNYSFDWKDCSEIADCPAP